MDILVKVSVAVTNTVTVNNAGRKGLFQLPALRAHSITEGSQSRNSNKAGIWSQELI